MGAKDDKLSRIRQEARATYRHIPMRVQADILFLLHELDNKDREIADLKLRLDDTRTELLETRDSLHYYRDWYDNRLD